VTSTTRPGGFRLRELPDGGVEFVLENPVLTGVVVADRVVLRFGATDVVVADPFELEVDEVGHRLDPARPETLGPLLAVYPATARCSGAARGWSFRDPPSAGRGSSARPMTPAPRRDRAAGPRSPVLRQPTSSSGWRDSTIRRMPSFQCTVVGPTSSCMRVRSISTLSMVSVVGANVGVRPVSSPR